MAIKQSNDPFCCHLLPVHPYKRGSLPRQGHQGLSQICKIFNKSAILYDKANELSDTFYLSGACQFCQLHGVTLQAYAAHNMSQENHFRLHEGTFIDLALSLRRHGTCRYPLMRSIVENHCWFPNKRNESSIRGK